MLRRCDECHIEPAAISLARGEQQLHLCAACAAGHGVMITGEGIAPTALSSIGGGAAEGFCPGCSATLASVRASGRLGCSECWEYFRAMLGPLILRLHGADRHRGRGYQDPTGAHDQAGGIEAMEAVLRAAVDAEAFEEAAAIRDAIRAMRGADDC